MNTIQRYVGLTATVLAVLSTVARAQENVDLSAQGEAALNAIPLLPDGERFLTYYNVMLGPDKVIGYVEASLERVTHDKQPAYKYHTRTRIHFPTKAQLDVEVAATFRPNFEPIDIELHRTVIDPDRQKTTASERATLAGDQVHLSGEVGDQKGSMDVAFPERPLIYGIETLVQRLDFEKFPTFRINEFDLEAGGSRPLRVVASKWQDGTPTVITYNPDDTISYQFWFDDQGHVTRWGEATLPALFVRTTKESVDRWESGASAPRAPGVKPTAPRP